MLLVCPQCNAIVFENAIHYPTKTAHCTHCDYEFSIARLLQADQNRKKVEMVYDIPKPARINKDLDGDTLVITRMWDRGTGVLLMILLTPFTIFLGFQISALFMGQLAALTTVVIFSLIMVIFGTECLKHLLNITTIRVDPRNIIVQHAPIPADTSVFATDKVVQVYVKWINKKGFNVVLILENGERGILLKNLLDPEQALYIEQEIEKFLGIADAPVRGEYGSEEGFLSRLANVFSLKPQTKYKF